MASLNHFLIGIELTILGSVLIGLYRLRSADQLDRMLAVQLCSTSAIAILVSMAHRLELPTLRDVALVFSLLATITMVSFARFETFAKK